MLNYTFELFTLTYLSNFNFQYFYFYSTTSRIQILYFNSTTIILKTLVTSYFAYINDDFSNIYMHQFSLILYLGHLKIADLQAHNVWHCDALWACRSAIFKWPRYKIRLSWCMHMFEKSIYAK